MEDLPPECQEHILAQITDNEYLRVTSLVSKRFYSISREALLRVRLDTCRGMRSMSSFWKSNNVTAVDFFVSSSPSEVLEDDRTAYWRDISIAMPKLAYLNLSAFEAQAQREAEVAIAFFPGLRSLRLPAGPDTVLLLLLAFHCPLLERLEMVPPGNRDPDQMGPQPILTPALEEAYLLLAHSCPRLHSCSPLCFDSSNETPLLEKMLSVLPHLRATAIQPMPPPGTRSPKVSPRLCSFGSQFKHLNLKGLDANVCPSMEGFSFYMSCSGLESLDLPRKRISEEQLKFVFASFPNLTHLSAKQLIPSEGPDHDFGISLCLQSLSIALGSYYQTITSDIFDELARSAPSLTTLELKGYLTCANASDFVLPKHLQNLTLSSFRLEGDLGLLDWGGLRSLTLNHVRLAGDLQDARFPTMERLELKGVKYARPEVLTFEKAADIWPNLQHANFSGVQVFSLMEPNPVGTALTYLKVGAVNGKELKRLSELLSLHKLDFCLGDHPTHNLEEGLKLVLKMAKIGHLRSLNLGVSAFPRDEDFLKRLREVLALAPSYLQLERDTWVPTRMEEKVEAPAAVPATRLRGIFG